MNRMSRESRGTCWLVVTALALVMGPSLVTASKAPTQSPARTPSKIQVMETYGKLPLSFEANKGQIDSEVKFLARGRGYTLFLAQNEAVFVLRKAKAEVETEDSSRVTRHASREYEQTVLWMKLQGANPAPRASGLEPLPGIVNYFIGRDPTKWRTNIPTYQKVKYKDIYSGIDLLYYGNQGKLEYDFVVSPGADPKAITLAFEGMESAVIAAEGDLVLRANRGEIRLRKPLIYQEVSGTRRGIAGGYALSSAHRVTFQVAAYDSTLPLIIDPVLIYSTYLGTGASFESDEGTGGIAVDRLGQAYVTGTTSSSDAFVAKLNAGGSALVYFTVLGGGFGDDGLGIAIDGSGQAYVTGVTSSDDFPTTANAFQRAQGGPGEDAFVVKLDADGAPIYSSYLGGRFGDEGLGIAVDSSGNAFVTGETISDNFPTTPNAFLPGKVGGTSVEDAFVTKLDTTLSGLDSLVYSTYLGGQLDEAGFGIAVDSSGNAYVTGETTSGNFPTTANAFQPVRGGGPGVVDVFDTFVTKLNAAGSALVYSTYLGGRLPDQGFGIAVDSSGNAYVTGVTRSGDFPTTANAFQPTRPGGPGVIDVPDAFVTKLDTTRSGLDSLLYSTYLGGRLVDRGSGIAMDKSGGAYVTGITTSDDFPTTENAFQRVKVPGIGVPDTFVTRLPNTPAGANVEAKPADSNSTTGAAPVTLTFSNVTTPGDTTLTISPSGPTPPVGFKLGAPPTYYDLATDAEFIGSVLVCIDYSGITFGDEAGLKISHFVDPNWVDAARVSLDTDNDVICGTVTSLSLFAIFEPARFATFKPEVEIKVRPGTSNDTFEVEAFFTLGAGSEIFPLTEDLTLDIGSYSTTIRAGFFKEKKGRFKFKGEIDNVRLAAEIRPSRRGGFKFEAEGKCADLDGTVNPVTVTLTIGNDSGSTETKAEIESSRKGGKCGDRRDDDKHDKDDD